MRTCKDCINYKSCSTLNPEFKKYPKDFIETDLCAKQCKTFQDKQMFYKLPCKVGDTMYVNLQAFVDLPDACIAKYKVYYISIFLGGIYDDVKVVLKRNQHTIAFEGIEYFEAALGRKIFFTREEAESAINESGAV